MEGSNKSKNTPESVPYIVFEGEMARQERHVRRLWIALLAAITAVVMTVCIFIWYLNQYDFTSYEQDGEGINILGTSNRGDCNVTATTDANQKEAFSSEG